MELACENIRFSSLFVAGPRETSSAAKSKEKRMFPQANGTCYAPFTRIRRFFSETAYFFTRIRVDRALGPAYYYKCCAVSHRSYNL